MKPARKVETPRFSRSEGKTPTTYDFVLIRTGEMPQKSPASFFVNERGKASAFWAQPGVQLNHILAVIDGPLKRRLLPHFL